MTLEDWEKLTGLKTRPAQWDTRTITQQQTGPTGRESMLWGLEDYRVSSVSGGTIWLTFKA